MCAEQGEGFWQPGSSVELWGFAVLQHSLLPVHSIATPGGSLHLWLLPLALFLLILKLYLFRVSICPKLLINMIMTWKQGSWGGRCLEFTLVCIQEHLWTQRCLWLFFLIQSVTSNSLLLRNDFKGNLWDLKGNAHLWYFSDTYSTLLDFLF